MDLNTVERIHAGKESDSLAMRLDTLAQDSIKSMPVNDLSSQLDLIFEFLIIIFALYVVYRGIKLIKKKKDDYTDYDKN